MFVSVCLLHGERAHRMICTCMGTACYIHISMMVVSKCLLRMYSLQQNAVWSKLGAPMGAGHAQIDQAPVPKSVIDGCSMCYSVIH